MLLDSIRLNDHPVLSHPQTQKLKPSKLTRGLSETGVTVKGLTKDWLRASDLH